MTSKSKESIYVIGLSYLPMTPRYKHPEKFSKGGKVYRKWEYELADGERACLFTNEQVPFKEEEQMFLVDICEGPPHRLLVDKAYKREVTITVTPPR